MYPSDALIRRAVRDHRRTARTASARWIVATLMQQSGTPVREAIRIGYTTWLRATAAAGLASALLLPAAAAATEGGGLQGHLTGPEPERAPGARAALDTLGQLIDEGPLLGELPTPRNPLEDPGVSEQPPERDGAQPALPGQLFGTPVPPEEIPPPARTPAEGPTSQIPRLQIPKAPPSETPPELRTPSSRAPDRLDPEPPRPDAPPPQGTVEERARVAGAQPVTPERIDQWVSVVGTAMHPQRPEAPPALIALDEVAPTPTMGWSYQVQRGDSLWRISDHVWANDSSNRDLDRTWRLLYEWNRDVLGPDPDLIYPGQVLEIPADAQDTTMTET